MQMQAHVDVCLWVSGKISGGQEKLGKFLEKSSTRGIYQDRLRSCDGRCICMR